MKILDCTLRDGGYYNEWNFTEELVNSYLHAISKSGVDFVELGLRNFPKEGFLGAFAYTTENYLNSIELPGGVVYGVMIDAKTILSADLPIKDAVNMLFCDSGSSKIGLVRIAAHFYEVGDSEEIAKELNKLGYLVGFNLMQAGGKPTEMIADKVSQISSWDCVEVLYFADSLGNMDAEEVIRITKAISSEWEGEIGIHAHNNMARALDNGLCALEHGVTWIDSTITGMGRGAGNVETENLLAVYSRSNPNINASPIYELVIRHFEPLKRKYRWGSNLLYFLGAQHDVHPMYIQNLLSDTRLGKDEIVGALKYLLDQHGTSKYDGDVLEAALSLNEESSGVSGEDVTGILDGRTLLLITNSQSVEEHKTAIEIFIKECNPVVISLNINEILEDNLIDYVCISHNLKFLSDSTNYINLKHPVIYPRHRFKETERQLIKLKHGSINFGIKVEGGKFIAGETHAIVPYDLTLAYVLAFAAQSGVKNIFMAGFEGYKSTDRRQVEMYELLALVQENNPCYGELVALTPTTYPIKKSSVYAYI